MTSAKFNTTHIMTHQVDDILCHKQNRAQYTVGPYVAELNYHHISVINACHRVVISAAFR